MQDTETGRAGAEKGYDQLQTLLSRPDGLFEELRYWCEILGGAGLGAGRYGKKAIGLQRRGQAMWFEQ